MPTPQTQMNWTGPFSIRDLLERSFELGPQIPEAESVYVVSRKRWQQAPTPSCDPLYVGSNTGRSARFRTRIGDLIADLLGFFGNTTGHSSGGQSLHAFCRENDLHPHELFIGWLCECSCPRCTEYALVEQLHPRLNKVRPPRCKVHG